MSSDFRSLQLSSSLLEVVDELGFKELTAIQAQSIPLLLEGKDVIGQSKTGSGKTAAFTLPILHKLTLETRALKALVLCPTRELSAQVAREMRKLGRRHPGLQVLVLSGGEPLRRQAFALEKGAHVAVGTPGRIIDHLERGTLDLSQVETVVLDEADRMLEMGFQEQMEAILSGLPKPRQTVLFSATFPRTIEAMSRAYQKEPVRVTVADEPDAEPDIRQLSFLTEPEQKLNALRWVLMNHPHESALVFCNLKASIAEVEGMLRTAGVSVASLHGDLEQYDRDRVMALFRNGSTRVLVATDVAARGLDIGDLDLVVNFDLPSQPEIYVHRIGRTGRAGKSGVAVSLVTPREQPRTDELEKTHGVRLTRVKRDESEDVAVLAEGLRRPSRMVTLELAAGRKDKMRPGDILGALTGEAGGLNGVDIGKIGIHDHHAYVAVARDVSERALDSLSKGRIKGRRVRVLRVK